VTDIAVAIFFFWTFFCFIVGYIAGRGDERDEQIRKRMP